MRVAWLVLGIFTAVLPGINTLIQLGFLRNLELSIPIETWPEGGFTMFPPLFVSGLAAVISPVVWFTGPRRRRRWSPLLWLLAGAGLLVAYFVGTRLIVDDIYWDLGVARNSAWRIVGDVLLLAAYCGGFALLTAAFALLADRGVDQ